MFARLVRSDTDIASAWLLQFPVSCSDSATAAQKQKEFIRLCTENLKRACQELEADVVDFACLTVMNRGLLILKSHVEAFRRKCVWILAIDLWQQTNSQRPIAGIRSICVCGNWTTVAGLSSRTTAITAGFTTCFPR